MIYRISSCSVSVTASGFKPETPSSVVRYSIQLSYAAIPVWGCKYNGLSRIGKTNRVDSVN